MYSLTEIFNQAVEDGECGILDSLEYKARICRAMKIVEDNETKEVVILNTTFGGGYYREITKDEYKIFKEKGWKIGIYVISLSNYRRKLSKIENRIKEELNNKRNAKSIQLSKARRLSILKSFTEVSTNLKELQND